MATKKKTAPAPAGAETEESTKRIPAGQFLMDSGLLFEINRTMLHPLGLALYVNEGDLELHDCRDDAEGITYDPAQMAEGRAKYLQMMNAWGYEKQQERKKRLGFIVQER